MNNVFKCLLLTLPLVACGGNSSGSKTTPAPEKPAVKTDYSQIHESKVEPGPLRQASESDLSLLLKNGLRASLKNNESYGMFIRGAVAKTESIADTSSTAGGFSTTNV